MYGDCGPSTPNFDPLARSYRWMEYLSFGPALERCRFHFLPQLSACRRALLLDDGDGRFAARLFAASPRIQVDAVDASPAMLAALERRVLHVCPDAVNRLRTFHADIRGFLPPGSGYDLVVSHFFLDCLTETEISVLIDRLLPCLTENALWLVSEFSIPARSWLRFPARALIRFLYWAFSLMTGLRAQQLPAYGEIFRSRGFHLQQQAQFLGGLLRTELWTTFGQS